MFVCCLFDYLGACVFNVCLFFYLSVDELVFLSIVLFICVYPFVCLFVCLFISVFVCLSFFI